MITQVGARDETITPIYARSFLDATRVCLERPFHQSGNPASPSVRAIQAAVYHDMATTHDGTPKGLEPTPPSAQEVPEVKNFFDSSPAISKLPEACDSGAQPSSPLLSQNTTSAPPGPSDAPASSGSRPGAPLFFSQDDDSDPEVEELIPPRTAKKRRLSPASSPVAAATSRKQEHAPRSSAESLSPGSRAASLQVVDDELDWSRRFLGTFFLTGWSTSKGSSYIQPGDGVRIERQRPKPPKPPPQANGKKGGKQTKLNFGGAGVSGLGKGKAKEKEDYLVRFSNMRGESSSSTLHRIHEVLLLGW